MSLCKRLECACGAVLNDPSREKRGEDGQVVSPNLGVEECYSFLSKHRFHAWSRALVYDDAEQGWRWTRPARVRA